MLGFLIFVAFMVVAVGLSNIIFRHKRKKQRRI
jgi:hypothetical protein